jgi:hypothetical protein
MTSDPDEIRGQIEQTRSNLSQDVSTLADTVNPAHAARRTVSRAQAAVLGAKDRVMGAASAAASGTTDTVSGAMSSAGDTVSAAPGQLRSQTSGNPLAVGLIAVGIGWLAGSLLPASSAEEQAAVKVKEAATPVVTSAARETAASLQGPAQDAAQSVKDRAADAAATVKDEAASSASDLRGQAQDARQTVSDSRG